MVVFRNQYSLDFEQPIWENDPELYVINRILENNPDIILLAANCFPKAHDERHISVGRSGMTLEQIVRCAIYKTHKRLTWRELSEATEDSKRGRTFMKMEYGEYYSHQTLQENISQISPEVLMMIHIALCKHGIELGVDDGAKIRTDSTVIESNINYPTNASLLWDCIRVSSRLVKRTGKFLMTNVRLRSYAKVGKKILFKIVNTKGKEKRLPLFKKMLKYHNASINQVKTVVELLSLATCEDPKLENERIALLAALKELLPKMEQVGDVAYRKEILGEKIPVEDKLFSIFETHVDCIVKGQRDVAFGHKVNFTGGKSNMILDCIIERGNPADTDYYEKTINNLDVNYDIIPKSMASDGGYASTKNSDYARDKGIINVVFNKIRGKQQNIATSDKMETMLKKWRSGIEAVISNFKRGLKASLCTLKGWEAFQSFVLWGVITFNLRIIARAILAKLA